MTEINPTADAPKAPAIAPIAICLNPEDGHFLVAQDGRSSGPLCWGEMIEQIIALTRTGLPQKYPMLTPVEILQRENARRERLEAITLENEAEERQRKENVTITVSREEVAKVQQGLLELQSWIKGWNAANDTSGGYPNRPSPGLYYLERVTTRLAGHLAETAR